jgi:hypothetical protein
LKGREFAKLARQHLMPHLPGFALTDGLIYAVPVGRLFRAFSLHPSGFGRERFTLYCVVAPLYQPEAASGVLSGLGDRLPVLAGRGDAWWEWRPDDDEAEQQLMVDIRALMLETGVPFLARLATVEDVARRLSGQPDHRTDPYVAEALAYSFILTGDYDLASEELTLLRQITLEDEERAEWWNELNSGTSSEDEDDWVIMVGKRGAQVQAALERSPDEAVALLDRWNEEQLDDLRIPANTSKVRNAR